MASSPGINPEHLLTRLTTASVVLQGLLARLTAKGVLAPAEVAEIKLFALNLARDLRDYAASGPQVGRAWLEQDVCSFFSALLPDDGPEAGAEED